MFYSRIKSNLVMPLVRRNVRKDETQEYSGV